MKTKRTTTFTHGTGVYKCRCCGVPTRDDGCGDSVNVLLCSRCWELGGIENDISDNGSTPENEARATVLRAEIAERVARHATKETK